MSMAGNVKQLLRLMRYSAEQYALLALRLHSIRDHVKKHLYANGEKYRDGFFERPLEKTRRHGRPQGPVVQSIVSLTSSLRSQLVEWFTTL